MTPITTPTTFTPTNFMRPDSVNLNSPSYEPTDVSDSSHGLTDSLHAPATTVSQADQFIARDRPVMIVPNRWNSKPDSLALEVDTPVFQGVNDLENDTGSDSDEVNMADDDSDYDSTSESRSIDDEEVAIANILGMTNVEMELALVSNDSTKEELFDHIGYVLSSRENSDKVRNAKQNIISFARTQNAIVSAEIFNAANGPIYLSGFDLSRMNFEGVDGCGANFSNSNLSGVNFSEANLCGAIFNDANLENALFSRANLECSEFERASLLGAKLNARSVYFAKFCSADLRNVDFTGLNLQGAKFTNANMENVRFKQANLNDASFVGANLKKADFSGVDLRDVNLSKTILIAAVFSGASFEGANLSGADLRNINFIGLALHGANFSRTNLSHANFKGMNLSGVNLDGADLSDADLSGVSFAGVIFGAANLSRANLRMANLRGANFSDSTLYGADLRGANVLWAEFGIRCGLNSKLFVIAERSNYSFFAKSLRDTLVTPLNHNGLNIFEDPFTPERSSRSASDRLKSTRPLVASQVVPTQKSLVVDMTKKTQNVAQQVTPTPPISFWSWITSIPTSVGRFLGSVFRRLWGVT